MSLIQRAKGRWARLIEALPGAKARGEMAYWRSKKAEEGTLANGHYKFLYTEHWGFDDEFYRNKRILDIGCGPRGSLEWADVAAERVGLDSLVPQYRQLGIDSHKMRYVAGGIENTPFEDGSFDVVTSVNSLDHVDDLSRAVDEIKRVTAPGGHFLLLVEVNHPPTVCEPISLTWDVTAMFEPEFEVVRVRKYEMGKHDMTAVLKGPMFDDSKGQERPGMLSALFKRKLEPSV